METVSTSKNLMASRKFKSYYVVWKRIQKIIAENPGIMFKSYYVVWKRKKEKYKKYQVYGSLNRTM